MKKNKKQNQILILLLVGFILLFFTNTIPQSILPDSEIRQKEDCSFITNAQINQYGERGIFIWFNENIYTYSGTSSIYCDALNVVKEGATIEGLDLCYKKIEDEPNIETLYVEKSETDTYVYQNTPRNNEGAAAEILGETAREECLGTSSVTTTTQPDTTTTTTTQPVTTTTQPDTTTTTTTQPVTTTTQPETTTTTTIPEEDETVNIPTINPNQILFNFGTFPVTIMTLLIIGGIGLVILLIPKK